jgi:hypothetical protein
VGQWRLDSCTLLASGVLTLCLFGCSSQAPSPEEIDCTSLAVTAAPATQPTYSPVTGHYYVVVTTPLPWAQARDAAAALSYNGAPGHLATVNSVAENLWITQSLPGAFAGLWIGGFQSSKANEPAGNWRWVTPEPWHPLWVLAEPNNVGGVEDCLRFDHGSGFPQGFGWNDYDCQASLGYVVEFEQLCDYGIYSTNQTQIRDRVIVLGGKVGSAAYVEDGVESRVDDVVSSGTVFLRDRSVVNHDVVAGGTVSKQNGVVVGGTIQQNTAVPPFTIPTQTVIPGTQDIFLASGQSLSLNPGSYRNVHPYAGSSLTFRTGVYNLLTLFVESSTVTLTFDVTNGPIFINVSDQLRFGDNMKMNLVGSQDAHLVRFYTNSSDQLKLGTDTKFFGVVVAPNAQIYAYSRTTIQGALYGREVWVDTDSTLTAIGCEPVCLSGSTTVDATIDGRDLLTISPTSLTWHHLDYAGPGMHEGLALPTNITQNILGNTTVTPWCPIWDNNCNGVFDPACNTCDVNRSCGELRFPACTPPLSLSAWPELLTSFSFACTGRYQCTLIQSPTAANGNTAIVDFNDDPPGGPAPYSATFTFQSCQ